jgi:hypothetical protein
MTIEAAVGDELVDELSTVLSSQTIVPSSMPFLSSNALRKYDLRARGVVKLEASQETSPESIVSTKFGGARLVNRLLYFPVFRSITCQVSVRFRCSYNHHMFTISCQG